MFGNPPTPAWTTPEYVAPVGGVLATGGLVFDSALTASGVTVDAIVSVGLTITLPATLADELACRPDQSSQ